MDTDKFRFLTGCTAGKTNFIPFFSVEEVAKFECGSPHSYFCVYYNDNWQIYNEVAGWTAIGMTSIINSATDEMQIFAVDSTGNICEIFPGEVRLSFSHYTDEIGITHICTFDNQVYVCGMGRLVMRRKTSETWENISAPSSENELGIIGFTSMASNGDVLCAVGWQGEIWTYREERWSRESSPTNANLNSVVYCREDDRFYIVGDNGAVVAGNIDAWSYINVEADINFQDIAITQNVIFIASDFAVYSLRGGKLQSDLVSEEGDTISCLKLISTQNEKELYSVGPYDAFIRGDSFWTRI
ncbi:hypothetical protein [Neptunomonas sp.]|uniref:hypothetical protein n=1 Tax=Neptunomonas sp. TaxID=1971898 RepID=UPI0025F93D29|nr:hypothetical protein [Neptunomonas sp.]